LAATGRAAQQDGRKLKAIICQDSWPDLLAWSLLSL